MSSRTILRDKILSEGAAALSDLELLSLMMGDFADSEEVAQKIFDDCGQDLSQLTKLDLDYLRRIDGVGVKHAPRILATFELFRRMNNYAADVKSITCSEDVISIFRPMLGEIGHEECWVLHLNKANRVLDIQRVSQGGVSSSLVDLRLVVRRSLELLSTELILVHNHPSGDVEPSEQDIALTERLRSATSLFNISLVDHLIISAREQFSFRAAGLVL